MEFAVLDIGGNFLGPALGRRELGHEEPLFCTAHPGQAEYRNRWITDPIGVGQALILCDMDDNPSTSLIFSGGSRNRFR